MVTRAGLWRRAGVATAVLIVALVGVLVPMVLLRSPSVAHAAAAISADDPTGTGTTPTDTTTTGTTTDPTSTRTTTTTTSTETAPTGTTTEPTTVTTPAVLGAPFFAPAAGEADPTNPWDSTPIPAVAAAARAAMAGAPLPTNIQPSLSSAGGDAYNPACSPVFGTGIKPRGVCYLGDSHSTNVVVILGDSHAGRWMPALMNDGIKEGFAIVPLGKAGCQINVYLRNTPGWPCLSWYRWAIAEDHKIHPVATLVDFLIKTQFEADPASTVAHLKSVLGQVTNGVLLTDPPYQTQYPDVCLTTPGATMGTCSVHVPSTYTHFEQALASMAATTDHPLIPTLQWFCAYGVCPMVIDNTLVTGDRSHMTVNYSEKLTNVLGLALKPILRRLEKVRAAQFVFSSLPILHAPVHRGL